MKTFWMAVVAVLICVLLGAWWFLKAGISVEEETMRQVELAASPTTSSGVQPPLLPSGMREFKSEPFRFALIIPEKMSVGEFAESGDARTYVFSGVDTPSFQIYVTPYGKDIIDAERFKLDQPSGVILEQQEVSIGGVRAVAFFGKNDVMGETREVWFVREGLLYEVTTEKENDAWLSAMMAQWQFF